jgi:hypothetical protein
VWSHDWSAIADEDDEEEEEESRQSPIEAQRRAASTAAAVRGLIRGGTARGRRRRAAELVEMQREATELLAAFGGDGGVEKLAIKHLVQGGTARSRRRKGAEMLAALRDAAGSLPDSLRHSVPSTEAAPGSSKRGGVPSFLTAWGLQHVCGRALLEHVTVTGVQDSLLPEPVMQVAAVETSSRDVDARDLHAAGIGDDEVDDEEDVDPAYAARSARRPAPAGPGGRRVLASKRASRRAR